MEILFIIGGGCILALLGGGGMTLYNGFMEKGMSHIKSKVLTTLIIITAVITIVLPNLIY